MLDHLETLHECGYVHRDLKPENFVVGIRSTSHSLTMIDFGLAKQYQTIFGHISCQKNQGLTGTADFASVNAHKGMELSRRDDLISLGYLVVFLLKGSLPWQIP